MPDQQAFDLFGDVTHCRYGWTPGSPPKCVAPATHRACWRALPFITMHDGTIAPRPSGRPGHPTHGGIDCCRTHANYYADAWAHTHVVVYPHLWQETWIERLPEPGSGQQIPW